jgi:hypothetical protein
MTEYHTIVYLQGQEATELIDKIEHGGFTLVDDDPEYKEVLNHLAQWDYGPENEHSPTDSPPWGSHDYNHTIPACDDWQYTIAWNSSLDYISLTR